jgi:hypothetical protein
MTRLSPAAFGLVFLSLTASGQEQKAAHSPFVQTWSEGRCSGCEIGAGLGRVQFINRKDVWAVGSNGALGAGALSLSIAPTLGAPERSLPYP